MIKRGILNHPSHFLERLIRHRWAIATVGTISALGMMAATAVTPAGNLPPSGQQQIIEQLQLAASHPLEEGDELFFREEHIERGDTIGALIARLGIQDEEARRFILTEPVLQPLHRQLVPGRIVSARTTEAGQLVNLIFPMNGGDTVMVIERNHGQLKASEQTPRYETHEVVKAGEIQFSLFGATDSAGIPDAIAVQMAEIFSADIDFHRDLRKGDRFTLVYQMQYHQGQPARSGRILSAEFINDGTKYQAFYNEQNGKGAYYSADGKSRKKAFLRSPLEFSRITSGFSMRFHPILQKWRAHKGVDYGAPIGTRVRSTGDGTIDFIGKQGGYGNIVVVAHSGGYQTAYGHLNGFAKGLRKGSKISQGDIIGYVGKTGWATGPHLHYEFRVRGKAVNPLAVSLPTAQPLNGTEKTLFIQKAQSQLATMALLKDMPIADFE